MMRVWNVLASYAAVLLGMAAMMGASAPAGGAVYYSAHHSAPRSARVAPPPRVVLPPNVIYELPSGCVPVRVGNVIFNECGSVWYSPYWYGPNVVYAPVPPPY